MLKTPLEQLANIVEKARQLDAETAPVDSDFGSNPSDNPTRQELSGALDGLDDDQRIEILALTWLSRGDFDRGGWRDALAQAREIHNAAETEYLIGTPLLADYLEGAIAALGYSFEDYKKGRLLTSTEGASTC